MKQRMTEIKQRIKHQEGFTLLEMLLVVSLTASLSVGLLNVTQDWLDSQIANTAGDHLKEVSAAVEEYIETTDSLVSGDITGTIAAQFPDISMVSPLKRDLNVELEVSGNLVEAIVYSTGDNIPYRKLVRTSRNAGIYGGYVANFTPNETDPEDVAVSGFGSWQFDITNFIATSPVDTGDSDGGHLVGYVAVNKPAKYAGPYLYRSQVDCNGDGVTDTNDVDCNRMSTNLDMNNQDLRNVRTVDTQTLAVLSNADVGDMRVRGDSELTGTLTVQGATNLGGDVTIQDSGGGLASLTISTGDVTVDGSVVAPEGTFTTADVQQINAAQIFAEDGLTITGPSANISVNQLSVSGTTVDFLSDVNVQGITGANTVDATNINVTNVNVTGALDVNGTISTEDVITNDMVVDCARIDGTDYGDC